MTTRNAGRTFLALGALLLGAVHCGGTTAATPGPGGSPDGGHTADTGPTFDTGPGPLPPGLDPPTNHRPSAVACPTTRPPGMPITTSFDDAGVPGCTSDSDCTSGVNGRCGSAGGNALENVCTYDECSTDSQCMMDAVCQCGETEGATRTANTCEPGNCRVDADCGKGGYCSPSQTVTGCGQTGLDYYCHTSSDECTNDSDCKDGGEVSTCGWQPTLGHWACIPVQVCAG